MGRFRYWRIREPEAEGLLLSTDADGDPAWVDLTPEALPLSATGDLVYLPDVKGGPNILLGVTPTTNADATNLSRVTDGTTAGDWYPGDPWQSGGWSVYFDIGEPMSVSVFQLQFGWSAYVPAIAIEWASEDPGLNNANDVAWTVGWQGSVVHAGTPQDFVFDAPVSARWWRIRGVSGVIWLNEAEAYAAPPAVRLPIGTEGQVLTVVGGLPAWATPA